MQGDNFDAGGIEEDQRNFRSKDPQVTDMKAEKESVRIIRMSTTVIYAYLIPVLGPFQPSIFAASAILRCPSLRAPITPTYLAAHPITGRHT